MATTNYGLEEINKQTDIISPEPINRNMVKIDAQMKTNELAIQSVSEQVATINVTSDVEAVIDRRVNTDRLKPLNTFIGEVKDAIVTAITSARDNIKTHVTSEHTTTKTKINTDIISARDSVNANVDAEATSIRTAIADLKQHVSNGQTLIATTITNKGISAASSDTLVTLASKIGQINSIADPFALYNKLTVDIADRWNGTAIAPPGMRTETVYVGTAKTLSKGFAFFYTDSPIGYAYLTGDATLVKSTRYYTLYRINSTANVLTYIPSGQSASSFSFSYIDVAGITSYILS